MKTATNHSLQKKISAFEAPKDCALCPRLVEYRQTNQKSDPDWFNSPVPSFGESDAELLIIGLAPGRMGANKTGRPFTGDWAGDLLYSMLSEFGLSEGSYQARPDDGLSLKRTMITNAVRCVPPENKPTAFEINTCRDYMINRIAALPNLKAIITLGKISHDSTLRALGYKPAHHPFKHAGGFELRSDAHDRSICIFSSYHCSRYNTNTGRLTEDMFRDVFKLAYAALN